MGKTKIKTIDDSAPQEESKKRPAKQTDSLVESLKKELGIEQPSQKENVIVESRSIIGTMSKALADAIESKPKEKTQAAKTKPRSKRYLEKAQLVDKSQFYKLNDAVELAQKSSYTKFPGTVEVHINTNQKNLRGFISLPYLAGKKIKILAFGPSTALRVNNQLPEEVIMGDEGTIEEILKGKLNFDIVVTTPQWMSKLAVAAKVLGPKGLMPNPKNGTITDNLKGTVDELKAGKVEYRTETNGQVVHLAVGKVGQNGDEIADNIKTLYNTLGRSKITKLTLSSTMGPGVKVDLSSI